MDLYEHFFNEFSNHIKTSIGFVAALLGLLLNILVLIIQLLVFMFGGTRLVIVMLRIVQTVVEMMLCVFIMWNLQKDTPTGNDMVYVCDYSSAFLWCLVRFISLLIVVTIANQYLEMTYIEEYYDMKSSRVFTCSLLVCVVLSLLNSCPEFHSLSNRRKMHLSECASGGFLKSFEFNHRLEGFYSLSAAFQLTCITLVPVFASWFFCSQINANLRYDFMYRVADLRRADVNIHKATKRMKFTAVAFYLSSGPYFNAVFIGHLIGERFLYPFGMFSRYFCEPVMAVYCIISPIVFLIFDDDTHVFFSKVWHNVSTKVRVSYKMCKICVRQLRGTDDGFQIYRMSSTEIFEMRTVSTDRGQQFLSSDVIGRRTSSNISKTSWSRLEQT